MKSTAIIVRTLPYMEISPFAAWNRRETLCLNNTGSGSKVSREGTAIEGYPIDELVRERVSFLKMDIEGSEIAAHRGKKP